MTNRRRNGRKPDAFDAWLDVVHHLVIAPVVGVLRWLWQCISDWHQERGADHSDDDERGKSI